MEDDGASNLAIAMAELGRKVVLIDGDCAPPEIASVFGCRTIGVLLTCYRETHLEQFLSRS